MAHRPSDPSHKRWQVSRPQRPGPAQRFAGAWLRGAQRPLGRLFVALGVLCLLVASVLGVLTLSGVL